MIDFNRKPTPKSEKEQAFDALNIKYTEKFGEPYTFRIGVDSASWDEVIEDIWRRIDEDDPQKPPEYEPGLVY